MATTKITNPELFDLGSLDTALQLPSGTTAERPTSPSTGEWRYNTTTNLVEFWDGGEWRDLQSEDIPPIPSENFNVVLYDGTSATHAITGLGFQPDLVWIKDRGNGERHVLDDSSRGATKDLSSDLTNAEATRPTSFLSFDSDGFTLGTDGGGIVNDSTRGPYVAWCWKANGGTTVTNTDGSATSTVQANTKAGFSIVTFNHAIASTTYSYGHGLGVKPDIIILKMKSGASNWFVYYSGFGATKKLELNQTIAESSTGAWGSVEPTTSVFSVNNVNAGDWVSYCFAEKAGYSKFGTYTGNGSTNGPIVNTGFEPAFVMIKRTDSADNWSITDNKRATSNPRDESLFPNLSSTELTAGYSVNYLSNGFQIATSGGGVNANGGTFLYIAFASDQSAAPVLADSFNTNLYTGTGTNPLNIDGLGFSPSLVWIKSRDVSREHILSDSVRGVDKEISSNDTSAEEPRGVTAFTSDGFTLDAASANYNGSGEDYVAWCWKSASLPSINTEGTITSVVSANQASGFSIVSYTGNVTGSDQTVGHGLAVAPEIIIIKDRDGSVYPWAGKATNVMSASQTIELNGIGAAQAGGNTWGYTPAQPTDKVFTIGGNQRTNVTNNGFIAYCFTSVNDFCKIGSYSGTGIAAGNVINVGFEPSFVLIKLYSGATSGSEGWFMFDNKRSTTNPRNKYLLANNTNPNQTVSPGGIDFNSTGFELKTDKIGLNNNPPSQYFYMAFKENPTQYPIASGEMAFLAVAGGGGGGFSAPGAGGAGGLRTSYGPTSGGGASSESNITLAAGTYTITIGSGGAGATVTGSGSNGVDSSIAASGLTTITSTGGGGGNRTTSVGLTGGSGGGSGETQLSTGGSGTANQGYDGGYGNGGGGGSAGTGNNGYGAGVTLANKGGIGGDGLAVSITGNLIIYASGGSAYYAAPGATLSPNPNGGGGGGASVTNGVANSGGGGRADGGDGGSGVVILRMNTSDYSGATTGSPTVTTNGSETILTYTGSGTYVHS